MYNLEGKVALVTGAGGKQGVGRAIAMRLAQEGADVVVNDLEAPSKNVRPSGWRGVPDVVQGIEALGRRALGVLADVSDAAQVERMVSETIERFGQIDILVNNAASRPGSDRVPVVELEEDAWDLVQRVNVKGTFLCSRAVARQMICRGNGGKILIISSTKGKRGEACFAAYSASKFAVIGFGQSLALELAQHRIQVNVICPGIVETERISDMAAAMARNGESEEECRAQMLRERAAEIPLGRIAEGADIARVAAFLASAESDYLTGLAISVTGGTQLG
jgi:NAD(P)-dependent dehydrogenase (short-subunit alcohol dehydrogenase family)